MTIKGLQKTTLIDYPGKIATTVFLSGCNFRCPWCYSPELVLPEKIKNQPEISQEEFFSFLKDRKGLLEGVVICGGEPSLNNDLKDFISKIKQMDFLVKLDTNGTNPTMIKDLIDSSLIDYVAMDIKGPKERYPEFIGATADMDKIQESINILLSFKNHEFRTTVVPNMLKKEDIISIAKWISGAKRYYLQNFRPEKNINPQFSSLKPYPDKYILEIINLIAPFFDTCQMR